MRGRSCGDPMREAMNESRDALEIHAANEWSGFEAERNSQPQRRRISDVGSESRGPKTSLSSSSRLLLVFLLVVTLSAPLLPPPSDTLFSCLLVFLIHPSLPSLVLDTLNSTSSSIPSTSSIPGPRPRPPARPPPPFLTPRRPPARRLARAPRNADSCGRRGRSERCLRREEAQALAADGGALPGLQHPALPDPRVCEGPRVTGLLRVSGSGGGAGAGRGILLPPVR